MIVKWDLVQGTEEWHRERYGKIGGTSSKGLFVESETLLDELLSENLEPFELEEDAFIGSDMLRGLEMEPMARRETSAYIGMELLEAGWLQSEDCDIIGISPDGITKCETVSAEIKCPNKKKHTKTLRLKDIPSDNIHQCLHYFTVNPKLERHYFVSFRPESKYPFFIKMLTLDSMVNLGTEKTPKMNTVKEWVRVAKGKALEIEANLQIALNNLEKI